MQRHRGADSSAGGGGGGGGASSPSAGSAGGAVTAETDETPPHPCPRAGRRAALGLQPQRATELVLHLGDERGRGWRVRSEVCLACDSSSAAASTAAS